MSSFAKAKGAMALLIAAMVTSTVGVPLEDVKATTTIAIDAAASTDTSATTTAPAVWLGAESRPNALAGRDPDEFSLKTYCTRTQDKAPESCGILTYTISTTTKTVTEYTALPSHSEGRCGRTWEFVNATNAGSALAADCMELAWRIRGPGTWTVEAILVKNSHQLVEWKTCAFDVRALEFELAYKIGNQDIIDLIRDSVREYTSNGKVGAWGVMMCDNWAWEDLRVFWRIRRNSYWDVMNDYRLP